LEALSAAGGLPSVDEQTFDMLLAHLSGQFPVQTRSLAADVLAQSRLTPKQLARLADASVHVGPMELDRVLAAFAQSNDEKLGLQLTRNLRRSTAAASLPGDKLLAHFASFSAGVRAGARELQKSLEMSVAEQREQLQSLLTSLPEGDVRRGQQVFHSEQAACYACHQMGYLGGNIGPDLTRIGGIRSDRDLLEAILYPSTSFVRSFEPVNIVTTSGLVHTGLLREDNGLEVVITTSQRKNLRIARDEIEEMQPGKVSIMPAGLDKQLTPQQLADLLQFLRSTR
jgi:putative heme-binding domain-containing protein